MPLPTHTQVDKADVLESGKAAPILRFWPGVVLGERGGGASGRTAGGFLKVEICTRGREVAGFRARGDEVWRKQEGSEWSAGG